MYLYFNDYNLVEIIIFYIISEIHDDIISINHGLYNFIGFNTYGVEWYIRRFAEMELDFIYIACLVI